VSGSGSLGEVGEILCAVAEISHHGRSVTEGECPMVVYKFFGALGTQSCGGEQYCGYDNQFSHIFPKIAKL
jgi:hypothetical protein